MSFRNRIAGATTALALAAAGVAASPLAGTAAAASATSARAAHTAAVSALTMSMGKIQSGPLTPGGKAKAVTFSVTNHTGRTMQVSGGLEASAHGAFRLEDQWVKMSVTSVHAPATDSFFVGSGPSVAGPFWPKGSSYGSTFKVPAHTTYTWKLSIAATKKWLVNDDQLLASLIVGGYPAGGRPVFFTKKLDLRVGSARTGGPVVQSISGGDVLTTSKPLVLTYRLTNRTGARLPTPIYPTVFHGGPLANQLWGVKLAYDVWTNGRWVPTNAFFYSPLPSPGPLANGATMTVKFRVRIVGWTNKATKGLVQLEAGYNDGVPSTDVYKTLHVSRA